MFDSAESLQRIGECLVGNKSPREKFVVRLNFLICSFYMSQKALKDSFNMQTPVKLFH